MAFVELRCDNAAVAVLGGRSQHTTRPHENLAGGIISIKDIWRSVGLNPLDSEATRIR